ncbi:MAG: hypothetical protein GC161_06880 [Planctomycetaceae bacterium]|nr:hypothetical protein [Planctomycetaceae bacterium]
MTPGELVQGALQQQGGDGDFLGLGRTAGDLVGMAQELEDQASQRAPLRLSGEEPEYDDEPQQDDLGVLNEVPDGASSFGVPTDAPSSDIYAPPHAAVEAEDESDEDGWEGDLDAEEETEYEQVLVGDGSEPAESTDESEEYEAEAYAAGGESEEFEETQDEDLAIAHADDETGEFQGEDDGSSSFDESESEDESFEPSYAAEEGVDFGAERSFAGAARPRRRMGALVTLGAGCMVAASLAVVLPVTGYLPFDVPYQVPQSWFERVGLGSLVGIGNRANARDGAHVQVAAADPVPARAASEQAAETPAVSAGEAEALAAASGARRVQRPEPEAPRSSATSPTAPAAPAAAPQVLEPAEVAGRAEEQSIPAAAPTHPAGAQSAQPVAVDATRGDASAVGAPAADAPTQADAAKPAVAAASLPAKPSAPSTPPVLAQPVAPASVAAADAPVGPPPPALAGGVPMGPPVASGGVPSGPIGRTSTLPGLPTERREGSILLDDKAANPSSPIFRMPTSEDLGQRWTGTEVPPLSRIQSKFRMVTPNVGRVRIVTQRGDVFDGRLDSMGESQVWLVMSLGTIAIAGETVARIDRLPEGPAPKGRSAATTSSERVRVKTAGGVLVGRVLSRDGDRVTILTDAGGRVTLVNPEIEPADQKVPGGVLGGRPPQ